MLLDQEDGPPPVSFHYRGRKSSTTISLVSMLSFSIRSSTSLLTKPYTNFHSACHRTRTLIPSYQNPQRARTIACTHTKPDTQSTDTARVQSLLDAGLGVLVLKRGKSRLFRDLRNSIVYGGAVERCISPPGTTIKSCEPVAVVDGAMQCLGYGFYNHHSMFRVRLLHHGDVELPWDYGNDIRTNIHKAVQLRLVLGLPCDDTNVYRIINSEGDRLSGLIVDRVGESLVVSSSAMWCEQYKGDIMDALNQALPEFEVIWRPNFDRLRQDGLVNDSNNSVEEEDESRVSVVTERGVRYGVTRHALRRGQKTGHYADQRENRGYVREIVSQGGMKRVLDLFCYTAGFGLNAALGGAMVTALDSSRAAVEMGRANAELNGVGDRMEVIQEDVMDFLRRSDEEYDMVIVDPPKYAPTAGTLAKALRKYRRLNELAVKRVRPGGLMITCSCSAAVARERGLFVETIREAAKAAGREIALVKMSGAAADHVVAVEMMESDYLSVGFFVVR